MIACAASDRPVEQSPAPGREPHPSSSTQPPCRVLLVDDDEWTRQLWRDILESYPDMRVVGQARDGREAVVLASTYQPDVILMDIALPHVDGIEATHRIRKTCPRTVIIGITGEYAAPTYNAMRTAGAAAFVSKDQVMRIHDTIRLALGFSCDMP
jgi:DNA-binding NarL/FixJ family response regulator